MGKVHCTIKQKWQFGTHPVQLIFTKKTYFYGPISIMYHSSFNEL